MTQITDKQWNEALQHVNDRLTLCSAMQIRVPSEQRTQQLKTLQRLRKRYYRHERSKELYEDMKNAD